MTLRDNIRDKMLAELEEFLDRAEFANLGHGLAGALADAAMSALRPVEAVADSSPVILYFRTEQDRADFIELVHEEKPGMVSVPIDD